MPSVPEPQDTGLLRLFFALPCPPDQAAAICQWRAGQTLPGRPVPEANLHLTLAFLGEADETTQARLIAAAERQHCPPFSVHLDQTGWFQRAKAAWRGSQL